MTAQKILSGKRRSLYLACAMAVVINAVEKVVAHYSLELVGGMFLDYPLTMIAIIGMLFQLDRQYLQ